MRRLLANSANRDGVAFAVYVVKDPIVSDAQLPQRRVELERGRPHIQFLSVLCRSRRLVRELPIDSLSYLPLMECFNLFQLSKRRINDFDFEWHKLLAKRRSLFYAEH